MTEAEWLASGDPQPMLKFLGTKPSGRKLRLFGAACCRRIVHLISDERSLQAVEMAERFADGTIQNQQAKIIVQRAEARLAEVGSSVDSTTAATVTVVRLSSLAALDVCRKDPLEASFAVARRALSVEAFASILAPEDEIQSEGVARFAATMESARTRQSDFVREVFGNPFRPNAIHHSNRTSNVTGIARAIYDDRAYDRLPILADALEDAGCDHADVLNHCRQPGEHVRGCWVLDLLLGKE